MILTLKELAQYLRVNERTILRMQKAGQIKGVKIGGQWRFNGKEIDRLFFPDSAQEESEHENEDAVDISDLPPSSIEIPVSRLLHGNRMFFNLDATDAREAIDELTSVLAMEKLVFSINELKERLYAREELMTTGVGNNIAIPHTRDPVTDLREAAVLVFGQSREGIDFQAVDGKPVNLVFLLCCKDIQTHLHMMGQLSQLLKQESVVQQLKGAENANEVLRIVLEHDRGQFLQPPSEEE